MTIGHHKKDMMISRMFIDARKMHDKDTST